MLHDEIDMGWDAPIPETSQMPSNDSRVDLQRSAPMPSLIREPANAVGRLFKFSVGGVFLVALLATAATIPVVNVFVLGYLTEIQGRVARTGKFRSAFYLLPLARRVGIVLLAIALGLLPIRMLAQINRDSWLLSPSSPVAWLSTIVLMSVALLVTLHLVLAIGCGGRVRHFIRPIRNVRSLSKGRQSAAIWHDTYRSIRDGAAVVRFPHLLKLGLLSYAATYLWLVVPTLLFTTLDDMTSRWQLIAFGIGCVSLTLGLMWLPLLLAHVAAQARLTAIFEIRTVFNLARRTPLRCAISTAILLACSVPTLLYTALVKNPLPPHQVRWDLMLVFLVTVMPARVVVGWAYHCAAVRPAASRRLRWRFWSWANDTALFIGVGYYVYFLYLAQTGGELGQNAIWQFHALLQPLPL